ncbi:MAG: hypothetical protein CR993_08475 [Rhodobacterales bacterium]|nr:MAG: hypothetical protein CR993_08475 [Rhodobacterales bacterium]
MNIAITQGIDLNPPAFEDGLGVWSSEDGSAGSATYAGAGNAAIVAADADFGGCLELLKTNSVQSLRWMGKTELIPGVYYRVRVRVKAVSGVFPNVRIAANPLNAAGNTVATVPQAGPATTLDTYGEVVEIAAIIGSGNRDGVDMPWGTGVVEAHIGLDLTGASGGLVRIDDIYIEDITEAFLRGMIDTVDVRDFGALGDGVTDDHAAFIAADDAAGGRTVVIPEGTYKLGADLTLENKARFEGTVTMAKQHKLVLMRNFDLPSYIDAFGDEVEGFKKGFQALMNYSDHDSFDMAGRRVNLTAPIDMQDAVHTINSFQIRRVLRNGAFYVNNSTDWDEDVVVSAGTYNPANAYELTNVAQVAQIQPGSHVAGNGVGREVYVKEVNVSQGKVILSQPLYGPNTTQNYTFTRFKYVLDFNGFQKLTKFEFQNIEIQMNGDANGVLLPPAGGNIQFKDCFFLRPEKRTITSPGRACQDLHIDRCQFFSDEQGKPAVDRVSHGFNVNANDAKIRDSRFQRLGTSMVLHGESHILVGNHVFQGDNQSHAARVPGIIFTYPPTCSTITGNYIDNCTIEWTNEHDQHPDFASEYSFGGLNITGNIFRFQDAASYMNFITVKPYGTGHHLAGLNISNNAFKAVRGNIDRIDGVDTSIAPLNSWACRLVTVTDNTFHGVDQRTISPVTLEFQQNTNQSSWTLDVSPYLPFNGYARTVTSVVAQSAIRDASNADVFTMPHVETAVGSGNDQVRLKWSTPCRGAVQVTARVDKPI